MPHRRRLTRALQGKGTLVSKLMAEFPDEFGFSVSHTSRGPRPGEVDGVHYHFSERAAMQKMIDAGEFLEHADVHGNLYGTTFKAVTQVSEQGRICVLDIDIQGVRSVKRSSLQPYYLFVNAPSFEQLEKRLRGR